MNVSNIKGLKKSFIFVINNIILKLAAWPSSTLEDRVKTFLILVLDQFKV